MTDIIQLLPDNIANQIAAGEVIQRPASAVKELMENAVDAGATEIRLFVNDAGKSLIQVIDNGKGMSETDARMAFERHATSKIKNIDDLFQIRTMGFRGEALASIAAVAQVEVKTKREQDETGTLIEIANSHVIKQETIACAQGTNISMKNVFFNVPARRNFLKSNAAELRHIVDEFVRVVLSFPGIFFSLISNGQEIFHLDKASLKQRVIQVLGQQYSSKLVTVQEKTDYLDIYGFVGKPDAAKRTRGDQYFFVNNRYIRSPYLNHALVGAFQDMIPADCFPLYVLFIDLDPAQLDINVHPTKQEIKFEDEKIVYAFVHAAVKHALAQFSIAPTIEFDLDPSIQQLDAVSKPVTEEKKEAVTHSSLYQSFTRQNQAHLIEPDNKSELRHWKDFFENPIAKNSTSESVAPDSNDGVLQNTPDKKNRFEILADRKLLQVQNRYIIATTDLGFILVDQVLAHERILYERYTAIFDGKKISSQRSLFPQTIVLAPQDAILLSELINDLEIFGFLIDPFGKDAFIIQGTPVGIPSGNEKRSIEHLLEQFKYFSSDLKFSKRERLIRTMSWQHAIKPGTVLEEKEMIQLISDLFACSASNVSPGKQPTYIEFKQEYLDKIFMRNA